MISPLSSLILVFESSLFFFLLVNLTKCLSVHWYFSKELALPFVNFDFVFSFSLISTLIFNISFLLFVLGIVSCSFSSVIRWDIVIDLTLLFQNIDVPSYKFLSKNRFSKTSYIFVCYVFIFIHIKVFSNLSHDFFFDPLVNCVWFKFPQNYEFSKYVCYWLPISFSCI